MEIIDITPEKGLTPIAARILYYCCIRCRISDFSPFPQPWVLWAANSELNLLIYKSIKIFRTEQLKQIPNTPSKEVLTAFDRHWALLSHWIYKKEWNSKCKIPRMQKTDKEALEREGNKWLCLLEVCRGLVGYKNEDKAVGLWGATLLECKISNLKKLYNPNKYPPIKGMTRQRKVEFTDGSTRKTSWDNNGKQAFQQTFQEDVKALRQESNPFDPDNQPWLCSIIQAALDVSIKEKDSGKKIKNFTKNFWEPYLSSYSKWANKLDCKGISFLWAENKKWYSRFPGTKRGGRKIPSFEGENYLEAVTLTLWEFEELSHALLYPSKNERIWMQELLHG